MYQISLKQARALAIYCQGLTPAHPFKGKEGALQALQQSGYVQIDTLSVVKRAHHHVLWSRVNNYQPEHLNLLVGEHKAFEYWAHAAAYLPMRDYRFTLPRKEAIRAGNGLWHKKNSSLMQYAIDRIRAEGPLMSRDFEKGDSKLYFGKKQDWATSKISQALFQLFMEGHLMVVNRKGFQKVYGLTENNLPDGLDLRHPSREEYIRYLIDRDVKAHGIVRENEIGYLIKNSGTDIKRQLQAMCQAGELVQVSIERQEPSYYTAPSLLEVLDELPRERRLRILSPFDNLLIQRKRLRELFGFTYILECYVPKDKRKIGYFSLPLLRGTEFVGQIDLKTNRKDKVLRINNLVWERGKSDHEPLQKALNKSLKDFATFNECQTIEGFDGLPAIE